jgi:hypothetical protein
VIADDQACGLFLDSPRRQEAEGAGGRLKKQYFSKGRLSAAFHFTPPLGRAAATELGNVEHRASSGVSSLAAPPKFADEMKNFHRRTLMILRGGDFSTLQIGVHRFRPSIEAKEATRAISRHCSRLLSSMGIGA